ncbi:MAG: serine/threonine protein kinase [Bdellovibrionales bacterium]|nr:serine/threonine protein kinase [Bdellovibrionales bacterium]
MNRAFFSGIPRDTVLFSRFQTLRCLSAHSHGAVYLCLDQQNYDAPVALKVIATQESKSSVTAQRFFNEIEVSKRVTHPHILKCSGFFRDDTFTAFGMEYMNGGTLADYLERKSLISYSDFFRIMLQLCAGVTALHQEGIIHRDMKPENILLTPRLDVKVADFGIASIAETGHCGEDEIIIGTLNYLSPEYIQHGSYDHRSDIYSLGVIAFELLTHALPFRSTSPFDSLMQRVTERPLRPEFARVDCPSDLSEAIVRALSIDPSKRFQSAVEFADALLDTELLKGLLATPRQHRLSDEETKSLRRASGAFEVKSLRQAYSHQLN